MFDEYIERIQPKPKFNLNWYKNDDLYSEGEIEDFIVKMIAENKPEEYVDAIYKDYNWSTFYHLTQIRRNILNWYPFNEESEVLEIGCGFGAITGLLCDKCKSVTAVELSKRRATGAWLRCQEKENLEIIVGNLNDITFDKKFDYITLIGVLEYQGSYTDGDNPYLDFLKKIKSLLKPNGRLLIAIENQYGLKYWCGAREDHTSVPFDGMNQYKLTSKKVRTFSKNALDKLIHESGYNNTYFYYPMPDYKLPQVIYSEKCLPKNGNMMNMEFYYTPNSKTLVAIEDNMYDDIIDNKVFEFFANSFLVECGDGDDFGKVTFASICDKRIKKYQILTRFIGEKTVEKITLFDEIGEHHLTEAVKNEDEMSKRGLKVCHSRYSKGKLATDFMKNELVEDKLLDAFANKDLNKIYEILDKVLLDIEKSSDEADWEDNFLYHIGLTINKDKDKYGKILKKGYLDMILRNAFVLENDYCWFDQEWALENVASKFILFRAIREFYRSYPDMNSFVTANELAVHYCYNECIKEFEEADNLFMQAVIEPKLIAERRALSNIDYNKIGDNISYLLK